MKPDNITGGGEVEPLNNLINNRRHITHEASQNPLQVELEGARLLDGNSHESGPEEDQEVSKVGAQNCHHHHHDECREREESV